MDELSRQTRTAAAGDAVSRRGATCRSGNELGPDGRHARPGRSLDKPPVAVGRDWHARPPAATTTTGLRCAVSAQGREVGATPEVLVARPEQVCHVRSLASNAIDRALALDALNRSRARVGAALTQRWMVRPLWVVWFPKMAVTIKR
jgi:hypothetical protein